MSCRVLVHRGEGKGRGRGIVTELGSDDYWGRFVLSVENEARVIPGTESTAVPDYICEARRVSLALFLPSVVGEQHGEAGPFHPCIKKGLEAVA